MRVGIVLLAAAQAIAQEVKPAAPAKAGGAPAAKPVRQIIEASVDKQRESVRRQVESAVPGDPEWFTVPFTTDKDGEFISMPKLKGPDETRPAGGAATVSSFTEAACAPLPAALLEPHLQRAALREGVPADLLRAVVEKESARLPCAISPKGAMGLMQLMPATAAGVGVLDPFDPFENLNGGARHLGSLLVRYGGDMRLALSAYNAGPGAVERHGGVPPFAETLRYLEKILGRGQGRH